MAIPEQTERKKRKKLQHQGDKEKKKKKGQGLRAADATDQVEGKKRRGKSLHDDVARAEDDGKMRKTKKRLKELEQVKRRESLRWKGVEKSRGRWPVGGGISLQMLGSPPPTRTRGFSACRSAIPRSASTPASVASSPTKGMPRLLPRRQEGKPRKGKVDNPLAHYYLREEDTPAAVQTGGKEARRASESDEESEPSTTEEERVDESGIDSDTSSSTDEEDGDDDDYQYGVESDGYKFWIGSQEDTPTTENETHRLAVVNMDWDHIKAVDLYVLMSTSLLTSCPQSGGQVLSVAVYPSEFGLKCMEVEAVRGPHALIDGQNDRGGDADDDDIDDEIANERIRSYQLQRLK
ncbi:unnamed protein product [Spirodela intermedia]|uniref:ESF1 RRM domain-containing protein n=1 Tax=Spirodela intermedia TaxID=51605 RepID=A0A7I8IMY5_SPIIN|nr:unnamed protein product [Spirodela intermedia]CAA6659324.1 unnamed protein product [Spirodela intermedia]